MTLRAATFNPTTDRERPGSKKFDQQARGAAQVMGQRLPVLAHDIGAAPHDIKIE
jgi:hypothetical protein